MTKRLYYEFFYYHSIPEMLLWGLLLVFLWTLLSILFHRKGWQKAWIWINRAVLIVVVGFILYWTVGKRGSSSREVSLIPFYSFVAARTSSEMYREVVANILLFIPLGLSMPFSLCRSHRVSTTHPRQVSSGADGQVSRSQPLNDSTGHLTSVSRSQEAQVSTAQCEQGTDISRALEHGSSRVLETSERESVETGSSGDLETSDNRSSETARWWAHHPVLTTIIFAAILSFLIELAQWKWGLGLAETDDVIMNTLGASFGTLAFFFSRSSRFLPSLNQSCD